MISLGVQRPFLKVRPLFITKSKQFITDSTNVHCEGYRFYRMSGLSTAGYYPSFGIAVGHFIMTFAFISLGGSGTNNFCS